MSVNKVLDIAKTITALKIRLPLSNEILTKTMLLTKKHQSIAQLFNKNFWQNIGGGDALTKSGKSEDAIQVEIYVNAILILK